MTTTPYERVSSLPRFKGHIFNVRTDRVRMTDGFIQDRDVVEHLDAVAVVALNTNGEVALIRQYRHPLGEYILELPAGLMDDSQEDSEQTARRELIEETGFEAGKMHHLCTIASSPGFTDEHIDIYLATDLHEVGRPEGKDEEADLTLQWKSLRWATVEIFRGGIISAHTVVGILAAKEWSL